MELSYISFFFKSSPKNDDAKTLFSLSGQININQSIPGKFTPCEMNAPPFGLSIIDFGKYRLTLGISIDR